MSEYVTINGERMLLLHLRADDGTAACDGRAMPASYNGRTIRRTLCPACKAKRNSSFDRSIAARRAANQVE